MSDVDSTPLQSTPPKRPGHRFMLIATIVLLGLVALVVVHLMRQKKPARGNPPQVVSVATAARGSMPEILSALGTVTPTATVTVNAAQAAYEATVANYRSTVLTAFQNVENDLSGLGILARQAEALDAALHDAARGAEIARNEYQAGTVDYTTVATAQATQLSNQQTALNVQESRLLDAASLIGDLGGGWSDNALHDPRHPERQQSAASQDSSAPGSAGLMPGAGDRRTDVGPL